MARRKLRHDGTRPRGNENTEEAARTAEIELFSDFFAMMKRPWTASQSRIVCIHVSLLGTAPLRTSALSWSIIHARRVFTPWISASALCRYEDSAGM